MDSLPVSRISVSPALVRALHDTSRVAGLTHRFYKYPARFSPTFVRAAIEEFTNPGDLVLDPFMGGGTALVEALAMGRRVVGTDTSRLAHFVASVKTTTLTDPEIDEVLSVIGSFAREWTVRSATSWPTEWADEGYLRNLTGRELWPIRKTIAGALESIATLETPRQRRFARAIVLRTAQWALDTRQRFPTASAVRRALWQYANEMSLGLAEFRDRLYSARRTQPPAGPWKTIRNQPAENVEQSIPATQAPSLIITSPPYPGVHVLYHRWQVHGGRETPAPFWIANVKDGDATSHYTLADRSDMVGYFSRLEHTFRKIREICNRDTTVAQLVAFRSAGELLPRYLATLRDAGFRELSVAGHQPRLVRAVPGRRWYTRRNRSDSGREYLLLHRLA